MPRDLRLGDRVTHRGRPALIVGAQAADWRGTLAYHVRYLDDEAGHKARVPASDLALRNGAQDTPASAPAAPAEEEQPLDDAGE